MNTSIHKLSGGVVCLLLASTLGHGQVFTDDFDDGTSGSSWTAVLSGSNAVANFAFDYSTLGIPSAPNSVGASTIGAGFLVNQSAGVFQGISATPNGQSFTGDFQVRLDMWLNYVGPLGIGGSGSTQAGSFGWGVDGTSAEWAGGTSGVLFAATLDGGSASDYRLYKNGAIDSDPDTYVAGSLNGNADYYTGLFGGESAPAAQLALFPGQTGSTDGGETAFAWYEVTIDKTGDILAWFIDGNLIASTSLTGVSLSGDNIVLGMFDTNASSSADPNDFLNTVIYDNIVVVVPEPSTVALALMGGAGLLFVRRRRK